MIDILSLINPPTIGDEADLVPLEDEVEIKPVWEWLVTDPETAITYRVTHERVRQELAPAKPAGPTTPGSKPVVTLALASASVGVGQATTLTATASSTTSTIARVDFYVDGSKIDQALEEPYQVSYAALAVGQHALVAKATDAEGLVATSAVQYLKVLAGAGAAVPMVALSPISPGKVGVALTLLATASVGGGGSIARVEFFDGGTKVGEALGAPYATSYVPSTAGTHYFTAKATDLNGTSALSAVRAVAVSAGAAPANQLPTVSLSLSAPSIMLGQVVTLTALAADADGTVTKVEFFDGTRLLATVSAAPYLTTYTPATTGGRTLSAKATDNAGAVSTATQALAVSAVVVTPVLTVPGAPTAVVGVGGDGVVTVSWQAPASTGGAPIRQYFLYRNGSLVALAVPSAAPYRDTTAVNGTAYTYEVAAENSVGQGPKSAPSAPVTPSAPVVVVVPPVSFNTKLNPGEFADTVGLYSGVPGSQFQFNAPLSANDAPSPATMLIYYQSLSNQVGQVDYNGADTGTACGILLPGLPLFVKTFVDGNLILT